MPTFQFQETLLNHYDYLPCDIDSQIKDIAVYDAEAEIPEPEHGNVCDTFSVDSLKALLVHSSPSKAIRMQLTAIEDAVTSLRLLMQMPANDVTSFKIKKLERNLNESLAWFNSEYKSLLFAEMDAFRSSTEQEFDVNTLTDSIEAKLKEWYNKLLTGLVGKIQKPEALPLLALELDRLDAAHRRMSEASQALWLAEESQTALHALRGEVEPLSTGLIGDDQKKHHLRNHYKMLQPYITNGWVADIDEPAKVDNDICQVLDGRDKEGNAYTKSNIQAYSILHSLGALGIFKSGKYSASVVARVEQDVAKYARLSSYTESSNQSGNNYVNALRLKEKLSAEEFADWLSADLSHSKYGQFQPIETLPSEEMSLEALFDDYKARQHVANDIKFVKMLLTDLMDQLATYNNLSFESISEADLRLFRNTTQVLGHFFAEAQPDIFNQLHAFLSGTKTTNVFKCGYFRRLLSTLDDNLTTFEASNNASIAQTRTQLALAHKKAYDARHLQAGTQISVIRVLQENQDFVNRYEVLESNLDFLFDNLSEVLKEGLEAEDIGKSYDLLVKLKDLKEIYLNLKEAVSELRQAQVTPDLRILQEQYQNILQILQTDHGIAGYFDNTPSTRILADQLDLLFHLISSHMPMSYDENLYLHPNLEAHTEADTYAELLEIPKPCMDKLKLTSIDGDDDFETYLDAIFDAKAIKDLDKVKRFMPKLLAIAVQFEVENNLQQGTISQKVFNFLTRFYEEVKTEALKTEVELYDADKGFEFVSRSKMQIENTLITPLNQQVEALEADLSALQAFLTSLNHQNSYWFTELSHINLLLFKLPIPAVNIPRQAQYLEAQLDVAKKYRVCYQLLGKTKYTKDFLNDQPTYRPFIPALKADTESTIKLLQEQIKLKKFDVAVRKPVSDLLTILENTHQDKQKESCELTLLKMAQKICAEEYLPEVEKSKRGLSIFQPEFEKTAKELLNSQVHTIVGVVTTDESFKDKTAQDIYSYFDGQLCNTYKAFARYKVYYQRLANALHLINDFEKYLENPEWFVESRRTIENKKVILQRLKGIITASEKTIRERFDCFKAEFQDGGLKANLEKDIDPKISDFRNYISYWFMAMSRAILSFFTGSSVSFTKDNLAQALQQTTQLNVAEEQLAREEEESALSDRLIEEPGRANTLRGFGHAMRALGMFNRQPTEHQPGSPVVTSEVEEPASNTIGASSTL